MLATHLIQEANYNHKSLQLVSFDIEKAFDRVSHISIIQAMRAFGIPEITIMAIQHYSLIGFAYVEVNGKKRASHHSKDRGTPSPVSSFYSQQNHLIELSPKTTEI
jgi:hypothetical protein